jgi:cell division protein FtsI (penicillin-binding protein 3)
VAPYSGVVDANDVQRWSRATVRAPRGDILARDGRALATTVMSPSLIVDPARVEPGERDALAARLAALVGRDPASVLTQLEGGGRYARIAAHVHPAVAEEAERLRHPAVWVERERKRYYPEQDLAGQVLGFVDAGGVGRAGLELALDDALDGGTIVMSRRRDRNGVVLDRPEIDVDASAGRDVHTTLDRTVQHAVERALDHVVVAHAPKAATAIVVDVHTGDVLALANVPALNPNRVEADATPQRNRSIQDHFEPGSVLKPFTMAAALESGLITEESMIDCEGGLWMIGRSRVRDDHPKGTISATEVLKYSSNIGSAKLAIELGPERFIGFLDAFGFGERTGIPLPGEIGGTVRRPARIKTIELATTAFGQGMTVSALQLAMATSAVANGGFLMEPRLVTEIVDQDGIPEARFEPIRVRRVISEETAAAVTRMMMTVTEPGGTGTRARVPGYLVAGKTGTAQKASAGGYGDGRIGSFIGFAPADDPAVAIVVMVDEPSIGSKYGGIVAAPAFSEIAAATLHHLGIEPDPALLGATPVAAPVLDDEPTLDPVAAVWAGDGWTLPDLTGRALRDVLVGLEGTGVAFALEGSGRVVSQTPPPGSRVAAGDSVAIVLR